MKSYLPLVSLFLLFGAGIVVAQLPATSTNTVTGTTAPAPTHYNLMLDVINKGAGGAYASTGGGLPNPGQNQTASSTGKQTRNHSTTLGITIQSQDKTPVDVTVEWYFFAKKEMNYRGGKEFLFDSGSKTLTIRPTGSETFDETSKVAQTTKTTKITGQNSTNTATNDNYTSYSASESEGGTKITGWVVRMLVDGKVIATRGSDFKYEDAAKDPDKFEAFKAGR